MPDKKPEKLILYTDSLAISRRFEEVKAKKLQQMKEDDIRKAIPRGHNSGLDADTVDEYHAEDLLKEIDDRIARIPRRGHGGGGGGPVYRQVLSVGYFNV